MLRHVAKCAFMVQRGFHAGPLPPRIPVSDGFLVDPRPATNTREKAADPITSRDGSRKFSVEVADIDDVALFGQFFAWSFHHEDVLHQNLDAGYSEVEPFFFDFLGHRLSKRMSLLAFDEDRHLVGFAFNDYRDKKTFPVVWGDECSLPNPKVTFLSDYADLIAAQPYSSLKARQISALFAELHKQTGKFVPEDTERLAVIEAVGIHPSQHGQGIYRNLFKLSKKRHRENDSDYAVCYATGVGTQKLGRNLGWQTLFDFPYEKFVDKGRVVFDHLPDSGVCARVMIKHLKGSSIDSY